MDLPEIRKGNISLNELFKLIKEIPKNLNDSENKLRILINMLPAGGAIDKLLFDNKDKKEIQQIINYIKDISEKIETIEDDKIDKKFFDSDEFYCIFKQSLEYIRYEFQKEKIKLFRNLIINGITKERPPITLKYYLDKIHSLELEHFQILEWYNKKGYNKANIIGSEYDHLKKEELPKISKYHVSLENDLSSIGFLSIVNVEAYQRHRYMISPIGIEFLDFIYLDD